MSLVRSLKRVASFIRLSMDFERIKIEYERNPEDVGLRELYTRECARRNEVPRIYLNWLLAEHNIKLHEEARILNIYTNKLNNLRFLEGVHLPNLTGVQIWNAKLPSLDGLSGFHAQNLKNLNMAGSGITSLKGFNGFHAPSLEDLMLSDNKLTDLRGLSGLHAPKLSFIDLVGNSITSLKDMPNFSVNAIWLANNSIDSLEGLENLDVSKLEEVDLRGNYVGSTELNEFLRSYPRFNTVKLKVS